MRLPPPIIRLKLDCFQHHIELQNNIPKYLYMFMHILCIFIYFQIHNHFFIYGEMDRRMDLKTADTNRSNLTKKNLMLQVWKRKAEQSLQVPSLLLFEAKNDRSTKNIRKKLENRRARILPCSFIQRPEIVYIQLWTLSTGLFFIPRQAPGHTH